jgi:hypothetical protein
MHQYTHFTDMVDRRGFISKEVILSSVTQEDIFGLVFDNVPEEFSLVSSPLRKDRTPGCWFEYHGEKLRFVDFANPRVVDGIKLSNVDCFDMVRVFYNIPNFYLTLDYIYNTLVRGKEPSIPKVINRELVREDKPKVKILIESRPFGESDQKFWSKYGIRKKDLMEDKVFAIKKYYALNTKRGNIVSDCRDLAYSYNDFQESRKKIYFPSREGRFRFLTNCTKEDVGGINSLFVYGKQLIITKSYKDYRVLKNNGKNVVWFQNEGMTPSKSLLNNLVKRFDNTLVWFDNDQTGIESSEKLVTVLNSISPGKANSICLPEALLDRGIKDPSDCIAKDKELFNKFLKEFTI